MNLVQVRFVRAIRHYAFNAFHFDFVFWRDAVPVLVCGYLFLDRVLV